MAAICQMNASVQATLQTVSTSRASASAAAAPVFFQKAAFQVGTISPTSSLDAEIDAFDVHANACISGFQQGPLT
jgi:hypothetical protein